ncbi:hypothetical protein [Streptomyces nojiriensis]|uniref:hypothetical protein n=1 Tax=Streptomyces nojiriensis TaxID=66374 RepID=UPI0036539CB2
MTAGDEQVGVLADGMTMVGMSLEALDAVVWDGLDTSHWGRPVEDVPRALRRIALAGPAATEDDCDPLYSLVTERGCETPSAAAVALPFVVALAADPDNGARVTLAGLLAAMQAPALTDEDWTGAWALLTDPDPAVRRAAIHLASGSAGLLERWRTETDPAVRRAAIELARGCAGLLERWRIETDPAVQLPILIALGDAAADPDADQDAADTARAVLDQVLGGDDPVLWVAAVYASATLDQDLPVRQLDRLVDVFSDLAVRPRFEEAWYQTDYEVPSSRENVLWWISRRLEHDFEAQLSFAVRLIEAAGRTGDTPLRREALDLAWSQLVLRRSAATVLLPLAGALLDDPDGPIRLRAANILAGIGPTAAPYADRLAELLDDDEADDELDGTVGEIARWALARTGDPRALPGLIEQLRAQEEESRAYVLEVPRRPDTAHVLIPLRANAHVLLPTMRRAIRDGGPEGRAIFSFLAVLEAWGEDALPALPDLLPLLADTRTSVDVLGLLRAMGPTAASAEPALSTCRLLDHPGNHWSVTWTAACVRGDRAAALRLVGDAVMTAEAPQHGPFLSLAEFGRDAAPYADRVRSIHERSTEWWPRLSTAVTLWSITGQADPAVQVLEEYVLPVADGDDSFGSFREALQGLVRIGEISPVIRDALLTVRESERRLSQLHGYEAILQDEELRRLIEQVLACTPASPGEPS